MEDECDASCGRGWVGAGVDVAIDVVDTVKGQACCLVVVCRGQEGKGTVNVEGMSRREHMPEEMLTIIIQHSWSSGRFQEGYIGL